MAAQSSRSSKHDGQPNALHLVLTELSGSAGDLLGAICAPGLVRAATPGQSAPLRRAGVQSCGPLRPSRVSPLDFAVDLVLAQSMGVPHFGHAAGPPTMDIIPAENPHDGHVKAATTVACCADGSGCDLAAREAGAA